MPLQLSLAAVILQVSVLNRIDENCCDNNAPVANR